MKLLLFGASGLLGWELQRTLAPLGEIRAPDRHTIDLSDNAALRRVLRDERPDVIVNAAAYTRVDDAEAHSQEAFAINAAAPQVMAQEARSLDALLVHYSTDYVFDGTKGAPYTEDDVAHPINAYGESKLAGERFIQEAGCPFLILRSAWLYGLRGRNFVTKVLQWARAQPTLRIVDDQVSNPTWARMLAQQTARILAHGGNYVRERAGLYHLASGGYASRYDWAKEILRLDPRPEEQTAKQVQSASSSEMPTAAARPAFSALSSERVEAVFGVPARPWQADLNLAMAEPLTLSDP